MEVRVFDQIAASPAEGLAVKLWAELHERGWAVGLGVSWDDKAIALMDGAECAAVICFRAQKWRGDIFISLGGVELMRRGQGLYRRLFEALCAHLREKHPDVMAISSGYHVDNAASARMHTALGRRIDHHMTTFSLR